MMHLSGCSLLVWIVWLWIVCTNNIRWTMDIVAVIHRVRTSVLRVRFYFYFSTHNYWHFTFSLLCLHHRITGFMTRQSVYSRSHANLFRLAVRDTIIGWCWIHNDKITFWIIKKLWTLKRLIVPRISYTYPNLI